MNASRKHSSWIQILWIHSLIRSFSHWLAHFCMRICWDISNTGLWRRSVPISCGVAAVSLRFGDNFRSKFSLYSFVWILDSSWRFLPFRYFIPYGTVCGWLVVIVHLPEHIPNIQRTPNFWSDGFAGEPLRVPSDTSVLQCPLRITTEIMVSYINKTQHKVLGLRLCLMTQVSLYQCTKVSARGSGAQHCRPASKSTDSGVNVPGCMWTGRSRRRSPLPRGK